jgi:hypothetical protein
VYISAIAPPWLYQGMQPLRMDDYEALKAVGVTAILSVNAENPSISLARTAFEHVLHIPWYDEDYPLPLADFERIRQWRRSLPAESVIYCHCSAGIHRSTIACIWLLINALDLTCEEANERVLVARPIAVGYSVPAYRESLLTAQREPLGRSPAPPCSGEIAQ